MNDLLVIGVWVIVIGAAFAFAWYQGYLRRFAAYVIETREELRKCTWPSTEELKGSTVVVVVAIALLGGLTVAADFVIAHLVRIIL